MLRKLLNAVFEIETAEFFFENKGIGGRVRRNGLLRKSVQNECSPAEIPAQREQGRFFEPVVVRMRKTIREEGFSNKNIRCYATDQNACDISKFIEDNYGISNLP